MLLCTETWVGADLNRRLCCPVCSHSRLLGFYYFKSDCIFCWNEEQCILTHCWLLALFSVRTCSEIQWLLEAMSPDLGLAFVSDH